MNSTTERLLAAVTQIGDAIRYLSEWDRRGDGEHVLTAQAAAGNATTALNEARGLLAEASNQVAEDLAEFASAWSNKLNGVLAEADRPELNDVQVVVDAVTGQGTAS